MIEQLAEFAGMSLENAMGLTGAADGADQIGAGLALKASKAVLLGIGEYVELGYD